MYHMYSLVYSSLDYASCLISDIRKLTYSPPEPQPQPLDDSPPPLTAPAATAFSPLSLPPPPSTVTGWCTACRGDGDGAARRVRVEPGVMGDCAGEDG